MQVFGHRVGHAQAHLGAEGDAGPPAPPPRRRREAGGSCDTDPVIIITTGVFIDSATLSPSHYRCRHHRHRSNTNTIFEPGVFGLGGDGSPCCFCDICFRLLPRASPSLSLDDRRCLCSWRRSRRRRRACGGRARPSRRGGTRQCGRSRRPSRRAPPPTPSAVRPAPLKPWRCCGRLWRWPGPSQLLSS